MVSRASSKGHFFLRQGSESVDPYFSLLSVLVEKKLFCHPLTPTPNSVFVSCISSGFSAGVGPTTCLRKAWAGRTDVRKKESRWPFVH